MSLTIVKTISVKSSLFPVADYQISELSDGKYYVECNNKPLHPKAFFNSLTEASEALPKDAR